MSGLQPGDRLAVEIALPLEPKLTEIRAAILLARRSLKRSAEKTGIRLHMLPNEICRATISRAGIKRKSCWLRQEAVVKNVDQG